MIKVIKLTRVQKEFMLKNLKRYTNFTLAPCQGEVLQELLHCVNGNHIDYDDTRPILTSLLKVSIYNSKYLKNLESKVKQGIHSHQLFAAHQHQIKLLCAQLNVDMPQC